MLFDQTVDDQVDALRQCVVVLRLLTRQQVMRIHVGTGGIDQYPGADLEFGTVDDVAGMYHPPSPFAPSPKGLDIVGGDAAAIERGSHEVENKACVVVVQIRVGILEAAGGVI